MAHLLYTLFLDPIPVGEGWPWLLLPLAAGIAVVYKTLKVRNIRQMPLVAAGLTVTILAGMAVAGAALWLIVIYFS